LRHRAGQGAASLALFAKGAGLELYFTHPQLQRISSFASGETFGAFRKNFIDPPPLAFPALLAELCRRFHHSDFFRHCRRISSYELYLC
jgi:hypothetical protein